MTSTPWRSLTGRGRRRQLGVAEALRTVGLGRRLERPDERVSRPSATSTSGRPASSRTAGVLIATWRASMLPDTQVTRHQLGVGRAGGVEQGEAVVDAGVDVEDQGGPSAVIGVDATGGRSTASRSSSVALATSTSSAIDGQRRPRASSWSRAD